MKSDSIENNGASNIIMHIRESAAKNTDVNFDYLIEQAQFLVEYFQRKKGNPDLLWHEVVGGEIGKSNKTIKFDSINSRFSGE